MPRNDLVKVEYFNSADELVNEVLRPVRMFFGTGGYSPYPQWVLEAVVPDSDEPSRKIPMARIAGWSPQQ